MFILLPLYLSLSVFLVFGSVHHTPNRNSNYSDPDLNITQNFQKNGYSVEQYDVETEDGYILDLYRIPPGKNTTNPIEYPVLLVHGMLSSADSFIFAGPNKSLPYLLSDRNYDVWLVNCRGSMHGRRHRTLNPDVDRNFWLFSWHEIGVYDLPATIDFILHKTSKKKILYLGHSQGSTVFFVMASELPEYNEKIQLSVQMAPTVFISHTTNGFLRFVSRYYRFVDDLCYRLNEMEVFPFIKSEYIRNFETMLCGNSLTRTVCWLVFDLVTGFDIDQMDRANIPYIAKTFPAGASMRQVLHYGQCINNDDFSKYDFGVEKNKRIYNSTRPLAYNLTKVTSPVALMYGKNDDLSHFKDVKRLSKSIPNLVEYYAVPHPKFNHDDFVIAKDVVPLVYNRIFQLFLTYSTG